MGDYSGMGGGVEEPLTSKAKKNKAKDALAEPPKSTQIGVESVEVADPRAAEGSVLLLTPDIRRRQRSLLGSLAREETKTTTLTHNVQEVRRLAHVTFDPESQKFIGLPAEWEAAVNTNFGLPLALCRGSVLPGYKSRIPAILLTMGRYLLDHGGRNTKGIFRIAPDQNERDAVLQQLANGTFVSCNDIHCISTGIKVWFRELPVHIFRDLDEEKVKTCDSDADAAAILSQCPEPALSVLKWLMDLCVEIINNSTVNFMTAKNMSIVITPNLYRVKECENPTEMLFLAKKFTDFFERCLNNRIVEAKDASEKLLEEVSDTSFATQNSITFTIDLDDTSFPKTELVGSPKVQPDTNNS